MSRARRVLLLAAVLLIAAESVSLFLLFRSVAQKQSERHDLVAAQATALLPQIATWARSRGRQLATSETWLGPFDELAIEPGARNNLTPDVLTRIERGDLSVQADSENQTLRVLGQVTTDQGVEIFKLTTRAGDAGFAGEGILAAQHLLVFIAALVAFVLASLVRDTEGAAHGMGAYEEAMLRLRQRDYERVAAFDEERSKLTATLRDHEAMARAGELTAGIVHEVGNSLAAISGHARIAEKGADEQTRSAGKSIASEIRVVQMFINRFMNFIRTEQVHLATFDLDRMVNRVAAHEREQHGTTIEFESSSSSAKGDEDLLERATENLVRNACQAAGPAGRVTITVRLEGGEAVIRILDDGPGIVEAEKALRLFESSRPGGLGLGLPLVLKIISLHRGTLDLRRVGQRGTEAILRWPQEPHLATNGNADRPTSGVV